jgi:hypothetical protein
MAEAMILALEGRYESYTLGRNITVEQVEEMEALGAKHGFELGGFRSFEQAVTQDKIEHVRKAAHANQAARARRTVHTSQATRAGREACAHRNTRVREDAGAIAEASSRL